MRSRFGNQSRTTSQKTYGADRVAFGNPVRTTDHMQVISGRQLANFQQQDGRIVDEQQGVHQ